MNQLDTRIALPAYDNASRGLLIELSIHAYQSSHHTIQSNGYLARCLHKNFQRVLNIAASIQTQWQVFKNYSYVIDSSYVGGVVCETASSSMGLSIGLFNLYRAMQSKPQIGGITGTGILRVNGCFDKANLECAKQTAAKTSDSSNGYFVVPEHCRHLFELEHLMETMDKDK